MWESLFIKLTMACLRRFFLSLTFFLSNGSNGSASSSSVNSETFVWGVSSQMLTFSLEDGDIEEAIRCAQVIGDNYLQEKAQGYSQPESFTHGTSSQRMRWLKKGLQSGDMNGGPRLDMSDAELGS